MNIDIKKNSYDQVRWRNMHIKPIRENGSKDSPWMNVKPYLRKCILLKNFLFKPWERNYQILYITVPFVLYPEWRLDKHFPQHKYFIIYIKRQEKFYNKERNARKRTLLCSLTDLSPGYCSPSKEMERSLTRKVGGYEVPIKKYHINHHFSKQVNYNPMSQIMWCVPFKINQ